ncbi:hypothetical protein CLAFUW4_13356 [Fulvia fulva]|uniref:Uncharacterized protein n=1 Tax=Passalora fulva TaxID=5499 RepID=A0A9Q8UVI5_PASFU|nr:uncharacterized protein CLAFUR5_13211 [Fulvia fulva]KAK4612110.1 hypothetical protein CLAFUR4_13360 [Fulvia fulva]KAK4612580.1 hypothetical protein CLAFUR0_13366 [Fulvia fulva]UJO23993.1 hypothetical protein CLAFUR5_13211 [Fulvia fulva]WPV20971.1 hypothetical protein CLAFUW4_13356 [Fulvia fulva]WPV36355.1 hypothetical protein CLAFUW7_13363 [Fulvia fulva]
MAIDDQVKMPSSKQKRTSLLDLPAEIWSQIGKLVIDDTLSYTYTMAIQRPPERPHQPPITRVCRVLRVELLHYFYSTKIDICGAFEVPASSHISLVKVGNWLRQMGPDNRRSLRGVAVRGPETLGAKGKKQGWRYSPGWGFDFELGEGKPVAAPYGCPWYEFEVKFLY